jgi:hypothetical protein
VLGFGLKWLCCDCRVAHPGHGQTKRVAACSRILAHGKKNCCRAPGLHQTSGSKPVWTCCRWPRVIQIGARVARPLSYPHPQVWQSISSKTAQAMRMWCCCISVSGEADECRFTCISRISGAERRRRGDDEWHPLVDTNWNAITHISARLWKRPTCCCMCCCRPISHLRMGRRHACHPFSLPPTVSRRTRLEPARSIKRSKLRRHNNSLESPMRMQCVRASNIQISETPGLISG